MATSPFKSYTTTTALAARVGANISHKRLGHLNEQVMLGVKAIQGAGVDFTNSITACDTFRINKSTQRKHSKKTSSSNIIERLQLVSTDLLLTPAAIRGYKYMAKYTDHYSRLKPVYFVTKKHEALSTLCNFVQDLPFPLGLRVQFLHSDNGDQ